MRPFRHTFSSLRAAAARNTAAATSATAADYAAAIFIYQLQVSWREMPAPAFLPEAIIDAFRYAAAFHGRNA